MQTIHTLEDAALWYLEFAFPDKTSFSQYLGVLDFDIARDENSSDQDFTNKKQEHLQIIEALLEQRFRYYQIYDSGNKGYHVYVYDMTCWLEPSDPQCNRPLWIRSQLRRLFGDELYDMIDLSNHNIGKGIRPYTCNHPKTGIRPSLLLQTHGCPTVFWEWFIECIQLGILPTQSALINDVTPANTPVHSPTASSPQILRVPGQLSLDQKLHALYQNAAEFQWKEKNLYLIRNTKYCCFTKSEHKSQKNFIYKYEHHIYITCHAGKCNGASKYLTADYTPLTDVGKLLDDHCLESERPQRRKIIPADVPYVLKEDVEWSLQEPGFGAIFAPMGSGKTKALEDWIESQRPDFKYLLICVRKSQASYFSHRYKDLADYQTTRTPLFGVPRLVICINSLVRLLAPDGTLPHYDLLILDEIESIVAGSVSKILSSGRTEQCSIWNLLGMLIKSSGKVLIMDGIPTYHSLNYFTGLGILKEFSVVEHHRQPDFRVYKCFCHQQEFLDQMKSDLDANKNVVLVTNTKEIQALIYSKIECDSKLMINADSEIKIKNTSKKPNIKWDVRFLAYNTAVGAGASFDLDHFHVMYAVVSTNSCIPQDFYQLICRIRKLKESKVAVLIMSVETGVIPSKEELKMSKIHNIKTFQNMQSNYRARLSILQVATPRQRAAPLNRVNINPMIREAERDPNSILNLLQCGVLQGPTYPPLPRPDVVVPTGNQAVVVSEEYKRQQRLLASTTVENYRLDICDLDYKLVRALSAERYLKLKHEDDFFLNTLIDFEHEKLILRDSEEYSKNFFLMIRRNGGVVVEIREDQKEVLKTSSRMIKTDARKLSDELGVETRNTFWNPAPDFNPALAKVWNKLVRFNDLNTQYRWLALRNRLIQDRYEVYVNEFTMINNKQKALSNCMLFSVSVLESFELLARLCPFVIDKTTGKLEGEVSIVLFHRNARQMLGAITSIYDQLYNQTQVKYEVNKPSGREERSPSALNLVIWKNLKEMFKLFGINCKYKASGGSRKCIDGQRVVQSGFTFCEETQNVRMAIAGLEFDTGEKTSDGIKYYIDKRNS